MVTLPVFFAELFPFVVFSSEVVLMCSFDTVQGGVVRGWPKCGAWSDNVRRLTMVTPPTFFFFFFLQSCSLCGFQYWHHVHSMALVPFGMISQKLVEI